MNKMIKPGDLNNITRFSIQFYDIEEVNPLFSKCHIRILHPGLNANGVDISKEVANQMATTLYNIPIVGEYVETIEDFKDHGGKIEITSDDIKFVHTTKPYGVVPSNTEIKWELITESDGTEKEYLTCWGYLWSGRYPEVENVLKTGNPQSMELDEETLKGYWKIDNEETIFVIEEAYFSALAILGKEVPPAFEQASIGSYYVTNPIGFTKRLGKMVRELEESIPGSIDTERIINFSAGSKEKGDKNEGGQSMNLYDQLNSLLNPIVEDKQTSVYAINQIYEDRVLVTNTETKQDYRYNYLIEEEKVSLGDNVEIVVKDYTQDEYDFLEAIKTKHQEAEVRIQELEGTITTLEAQAKQTENETIQGLQTLNSQLTEENKTLSEFKNKIELQEKESIIDNFKQILTEEEIVPFTEKIQEYSLEQLEEKLSVIAIKKSKDFSKDTNPLIPGSHGHKDNSGWVQIVEKHNS